MIINVWMICQEIYLQVVLVAQPHQCSKTCTCRECHKFLQVQVAATCNCSSTSLFSWTGTTLCKELLQNMLWMGKGNYLSSDCFGLCALKPRSWWSVWQINPKSCPKCSNFTFLTSYTRTTLYIISGWSIWTL